METIRHNGITWVDVQDPTDKDLGLLHGDYRIHSLVLKELQKPTLRPRAEDFEDHLYLVLHFPIFNTRERKTYPQELDIILTKDTLITVHYGRFEVVDYIFEKMKRDSDLLNEAFRKNAGYLFYQLVSALFSFSLRELDHIALNLNRAEERVFSDRHHDLIEEISFIRRDILAFRRTVQPMQTVFSSLEHYAPIYFGPEFRPYLTGLLGEYNRLWHLLENQKDSVESLQGTVDSLSSARTNKVMRILTIIATATFPFTLIAGIFSMDELNLSRINSEHGFLIVFGVMIFGMAALVAFFRYKKWF